MSDLITIFAEVLAVHSAGVVTILREGAEAHMAACRCGWRGDWLRTNDFAEVQCRVHVGERLAAAVATRSPLLSERYGPDNPGQTPYEQNLFANGALWWHGQLTGEALPDRPVVPPVTAAAVAAAVADVEAGRSSDLGDFTRFAHDGEGG